MLASFRILGPLTVERGASDPSAIPVELDTGPFKQRLLLALLLCRCNSVVLVEELVDALWPDDPPRTAYKNVQIYFSHLRKLLSAADRPDTLRYHPSGYQLVLTSPEVDALRFEDLSRAGRLALRRGDPGQAAATMRQALGLWRGPVLADLQASPALRKEADRLHDRRLSVYEDWFEAELLLGNHAEVLEEIEAVGAAHPQRERLRSHQLTALYRGGRQAEALAEYDNLRQLLTTELGLDPSPALQRLYQGILSGNGALSESREIAGPAPALGVPAADVVAHFVTVPAEPTSSALAGTRDSSPEEAPAAKAAPRPSGLPRAVDDFTGRQDVLDRLLTFIRGGDADASQQRRLAAVVGPPGAGTSTLALQAAHVLAPAFRDGQMLLQLRDEKGAPRPAAELTDELLNLLEPFPCRSSAAVGGRSAVLRGRLAGLHLLLILDGVADEAQVRPLLPGAGHCSVILTSCRTLSGLDGVSRFPVGLFTVDEALSLLGRIIGAERVERAREAAIRIVRACGLLPLAVRIAGARLADLDQLRLDRFADRLEDDDRLLDELAIGDLVIRECFDRYLRGLDSAERMALLLIAAAWGLPSRKPSEIEHMLERLTGVHALTITDGALRSAASPLPFEMPAPLWVYAQRLTSAAVSDADR